MRQYTTALQPLADRAAIGLSILCALHCLALPVVTTLLPSLVALGLEDESFHIWLVIVVLPLSAFALTMGCVRHRKMGVLYTGLVGLLVLCITPLFGHEVLGSTAERLLTLGGSILVAASHVNNFRLCRQGNSCDCPE